MLIHSNVRSQSLEWLKTDNDTSYITDLTEDLIVRAYLANKFTTYALGDYDFNKRLSYKANDNYNLGLGFNYKYLGLNIAFKLPFVNNDTVRYGKTEFFDVQTFIYLRKITIDLYYLSYTGYYLPSTHMLYTPPASNIFPQRGDLHTRNIGMNAQYIFNDKKFSYRAAFLQNEYQKKSAGSFIAGMGLHSIKINADSAIIPSDIRYDTYFDNSTFTRSNIISLALNAGYAHTFVIRKNFFITTSLLGGAGINYTTMKTAANKHADGRLALQLNSIVRLSAGYSTTDYFAGVQYINFINRNNAPVIGTWQEFQAGNVKLTFAKRFKFKRATKNKIDRIENSIKAEIGIQADTTRGE